MTVNKEHMRLWVDALRSGEFTQTKGVNYRPEPFEGDEDLEPQPAGYCCLGVACEVAVKNGFVFMDYTTDEPLPADEQGWWRGEGDLPSEVRDWLGLTRSNPTIADVPATWTPKWRYATPKTEPVTTAIIANDELGWTFAQIADALEAKYLSDSTEEDAN